MQIYLWDGRNLRTNFTHFYNYHKPDNAWSLPECLWWPAQCWFTPAGERSEVDGPYPELKYSPRHEDPERPKRVQWAVDRANMRPSSEHSELRGTGCKAVRHENA
jgi:hypothetical protein